MRIIFVRHGEPNYALDCLTEMGVLQAEKAAQRLRSENIDAMFSSPQGRALQTAQAASRAYENMPVEKLDFMHEVSWGSLDGSPLFENGHPWAVSDELIRQGYDVMRRDWESHPLFKNNLVTDCVRLIAGKIDQWLSSLGYEREGLYYRNTLDGENRRTVALFSHGGSSTAALAHITNIPFPYLCTLFHMPFTSLTILRFDPEPGSLCAPHLELSGDAKHIEGI